MLFCHRNFCAGKRRKREFKLQSKVQPNEICALNNVHVRAINMSHILQWPGESSGVPTSGDKLMLD